MRMVVFALIFLSAFVSSNAKSQESPVPIQQLGSSFDCRRDNGVIPRLVCNDPDLRQLDLLQLAHYYTLRQALPQAHQELRATFIDRLEKLKLNCAEPAAQTRSCVVGTLEQMRSHWLSRIQSLSNQSALEESRLDVRQLLEVQQKLRDRGLLPANSVSDGLFGTATRNALNRLQIDLNLPPDGFVSSSIARHLISGPLPNSSARGPTEVFLPRGQGPTPNSSVPGYSSPPSTAISPAAVNSPPANTYTRQPGAVAAQIPVSTQNNNWIWIIVLASVILGITYIYFGMKSDSKCPQCGVDWAYKTVSSYNEPRSTFQVQRRAGEHGNGSTRYEVTTYEVGTMHTTRRCETCDHEASYQSSYKKSIGSHIQ